MRLQPDLRDMLTYTVLYDTPAWVRVGLTAPVERIRQEAASELISTVLQTLERPPSSYDRDQLTLDL